MDPLPIQNQNRSRSLFHVLLLFLLISGGDGGIGPTVRCIFDKTARTFDIAVPGPTPDAPVEGMLDRSVLASLRPTHSGKSRSGRPVAESSSVKMRMNGIEKAKQLKSSNNRKVTSKPKVKVNLKPNVPKSVRGITVANHGADVDVDGHDGGRYAFELFDHRDKSLAKEASKRGYLTKPAHEGLLENLLGWKAVSSHESFVRNQRASGVEWVEYHGDQKFAVFDEVYVNLDHSVVILFDPLRSMWLQIVSLEHADSGGAEGDEDSANDYSVILWSRKAAVNGITEILANEWGYLQVGRWVLA